ncbi:MAG TPA: hypothetical protein PLZ57_09845 [Pseudobdellovibrionaceae bacterium]|nr:hypothetical protein [Pseudobdellovibrionaceae bacterium]
MRGNGFEARRTLLSIAVLALVGKLSLISGVAEGSTSRASSGTIEAELIFSSQGAESRESYRLVRMPSTPVKDASVSSGKTPAEVFMLVYRWGDTDLQRQVLTENWAKEIRADFEALARMSVASKKTLGPHCTAPVEVRRLPSHRSGWFCDSSLSPRDRETWQNTLGRLRHVAEWGWERPTSVKTESPAPAPRKKN